ncbi:EpsG family protein [Prevotella sp. HUN102]|uniref:EpsG family protein n=1 Tax=Prevotella sp. HUN102 TaxID=1392486 RepID=UPI00048AE298|nr:EpsG family protein [Prevotella sp. HUN102]
MWLYLIIIFIPIFLYSFGGEKIARNKLVLGLYMSFLAFFVGMSDMMGGSDRYLYSSHFDDIADWMRNGISISDPQIADVYEKGFVALNCLVAMFSKNRYIFILCITLLMYFNFYVAIKRHIKNYPFAMIIFLCLYFYFTFTYLRQMMGVSFAALSIKYLLEKKRVAFLLFILLVVLMHKSGVFYALIFFIPVKKLKPSYVILGLSFCLLLGLSGVSSYIYDIYIETTSMDISNSYAEESGIRWAYILEVILFAGTILYNYDKIENNRENIIFTNMALMFCATLLVFLRSGNGGRLSWYFMFGIMYVFSTLVSQRSLLKLYAKKQLALVVVGMLFFQYIRVYINWQNYLNLYPYKTFLTNGYREGDYSWIHWEYDHQYDNNKLYREPFSFVKPKF